MMVLKRVFPIASRPHGGAPVIEFRAALNSAVPKCDLCILVITARRIDNVCGGVSIAWYCNQRVLTLLKHASLTISPIVLLRWCTQSGRGMMVGTSWATLVRPRSVLPVLSDTIQENRECPMASMVLEHDRNQASPWHYKGNPAYHHHKVSKPFPSMRLSSRFANLE